MRFKTNKAKLNTAVSRLQSIVPPKSTIPILSNILFDLQGDKLELKATDLDVSMTSTIDVEVLDKGSITVPAKVFSEIVKELPDYELEIIASENRMEIKCGSGTYKLSGFSAEDFPKLPDIHPGRQIKIKAQSFYEMIKKVLFAVSKDETRPALNGVLWHTSENGLNLVATDGHRLAKITRTDIKITGYKEDIVIPPKILDNLIKLTSDDTGEIGVILNENSIVFMLEDAVITSRLLEGPYPNYEQVVPKDNDKIMLVEKELLQAAVRRVSILSNSLTRQVKFAIANDNLELSATNFDFGGEAKESLKVSYSEEELDIGYNANYILDVLKQIDGDEVQFELSNSTTATVIKPQTSSENETNLFLIMPLRLME
ncbi:MAG: DNA polymerase III subunit beta [candidate division Zixibacteria bacterium]|nr:DNA polymerase III subunit beta [candidate division Zixibacteria bacterium]